MALFTAEDVTFRSRNEELVHGISLEIEEKGVTVISGESGSGKSILLKMIGGILIPTTGRVLFDGMDIALMTKAEEMNFRRRCSMMFQDAALWANQSIEQNLHLPLQTNFPSMTLKERKERVSEVCEMVKYTKPLSLRPANLSMGEQKRIAFARSIICRPEILLLDECTESLDVQGTAVLVKLLHKFLDEGNTLIYISHQDSFNEEFPGKKIYVENGRLGVPKEKDSKKEEKDKAREEEKIKKEKKEKKEKEDKKSEKKSKKKEKEAKKKEKESKKKS